MIIVEKEKHVGISRVRIGNSYDLSQAIEFTEKQIKITAAQIEHFQKEVVALEKAMESHHDKLYHLNDELKKLESGS